MKRKKKKKHTKQRKTEGRKKSKNVKRKKWFEKMESKERNPIEKAKTKSEIIKDNIYKTGAHWASSDSVIWIMFHLICISNYYVNRYSIPAIIIYHYSAYHNRMLILPTIDVLMWDCDYLCCDVH